MVVVNRVATLLEELGERAKRPYLSIDKREDLDCLQLRMLLAEWTRLSQHSMTSQKIYRQFAKKVIVIINRFPPPLSSESHPYRKIYTHT